MSSDAAGTAEQLGTGGRRRGKKGEKEACKQSQTIIFRFYEPKKGNLCGNILISIDFGVLEYWSFGVLLKV
jgi:hypothetical protein